MTIQKLKSEYLETIRLDDDLKIKIAKANGIKIKTVEDWRRANVQMLTTATNLRIIREHLNLSSDEELTGPEELEDTVSEVEQR